MPYGFIFDALIVFMLVAAIVKADDTRARIGLGAALAVAAGLPYLVTMRPLGGLWWIHTILKILAGLACLVYLKWGE